MEIMSIEGLSPAALKRIKQEAKANLKNPFDDLGKLFENHKPSIEEEEELIPEIPQFFDDEYEDYMIIASPKGKKRNHRGKKRHQKIPATPKFKEYKNKLEQFGKKVKQIDKLIEDFPVEERGEALKAFREELSSQLTGYRVRLAMNFDGKELTKLNNVLNHILKL
jgi:hypothetical protein